MPLFAWLGLKYIANMNIGNCGVESGKVPVSSSLPYSRLHRVHQHTDPHDHVLLLLLLDISGSSSVPVLEEVVNHNADYPADANCTPLGALRVS